MTWFWGLVERLRNLFRRRQAEEELEEEIRFHLERAVEKNIRRGMSGVEARRAALIAFGGEERIKEQTRRERGVHVLLDLRQDIRQALRDLKRRPGFSAVVILTLVLCVGANTAIFPLINTVVLRALPYPDARRLVYVYNSAPGADEERLGNNYIDFHQRREGVEAFDEVALFTYGGGVVGMGRSQRHVFTTSVTPSYFSLLGVRPAAGRFFLETEDQGEPGAGDREVILSHGFWQQYFGGGDDVIGQTLIMGETSMVVVGVLPAHFRLPTWETDVFLRLSWPGRAWAEDQQYNDNTALEMIARLKPGATIEQATEQIAAINEANLEKLPAAIREIISNASYHTVVRGWHDDLIRNLRRPLLLLWGGVLLVLLIGCVNITNLLLVRTSSALPDLATRHALGAGLFRLVRQQVTGSLVLCTLGGAIGIAVGAFSLKLLSAFAVWEIPLISEVRLDRMALLFSGGLVLAVGLLSGLAPALRYLREGYMGWYLRGGRRSARGRGSLGLQNTLVSAQIAVTFILLMGAGLLYASLRNVLAIEPGFEAEGVLANAVSLPVERYPAAAARIAAQESILDEIEALPGVQSAAITSQLPFSGIVNSIAITVEGYEPGPGESVTTPYSTWVSPGYFSCLGIPLLRGRDFTASDRADTLPVVIIDQNLARRYWPDTDPIGKRMHPGIDDESEPGYVPDWHTIIGVVGSVKHNDLLEPDPGGAFYRPLAQSWLTYFRTVVRTDGEPRSFAPAVRTAVQRVDPAVLPYWTADLAADLTASLIPRRTPMQLLMTFASVALLLAALGVYGVLAYAVGRRAREIGIRVALGGTNRQIVRLIGGQWLRMIVAGLAIGIAGAFALIRFIASQLYGVAPADPAVFLAVMLILGAVAASACLLPIRRALRLDPVAVLRVE